MNRILRGTVLLAVSALVWGCNTEPEETQGGDPTQIVASPTVVFVDRGSTDEVFVRLVDQQGTSLSSEVSVTVADPSVIQVSADSLYRPVFGPDGVLGFNTNNSELRLVVTGLTNAATSFTISAGGLTEEVDVAVVPIAFDAALSTAAPNLTETFTITAPAGLSFSPTSGVVSSTGAAAAYTISVSGDGSTLTAVGVPGATGAMSVTGIVPSYAPTLTVTLPLTTTFATTSTVGAGFTGTDAIATAPVLLDTEPGSRTGIVDIGNVLAGATPDGDGARYYRFVVEEGAVFDFSLVYDGGKDLGIYLYDAEGASLGAIADAHGTGAEASPEAEADVALEAGTYYVGIIWFDYGAAFSLPEFFTLEISEHE